MHLFSAAPEKVEFVIEHYRVESADLSTAALDLFRDYTVEGLHMPYTREDLRRDIARETLHELTVEERLAGLSPEQLLAGLTAAQIEAYLKRLRKQPTAAKKKKPKPGN